jgi:hypothetical protein
MRTVPSAPAQTSSPSGLAATAFTGAGSWRTSGAPSPTGQIRTVPS